MKTVFETHFKVVTPSKGMWLYNRTDGIITDSLTMPLGASEDAWEEITDEDKLRIEQEEEVEQ